MAKKTKNKTDKASSTVNPKQPVVAGIPAGASIVDLPLTEIGSDATFMFRANLRVGDLKASIGRDGQQLPIVVRRNGDASDAPYQVVSGFRRLRAVSELGWPTIAAIVRDDLDDDSDAFRASVLENTARKTYSDIDRAIAMKRYQDAGHKGADIAAMMGMSDRRRKAIASLLSMPEVVQEAVDDPEHPLTTKHAVMLSMANRKYGHLDWAGWVERVKTEEWSANQMKRALNKELGSATASEGFTSLFQERGTDLDKGEVWFAPVRVKVGEMSDGDKARLRAELQQILDAL